MFLSMKYKAIFRKNVPYIKKLPHGLYFVSIKGVFDLII